MCVGVFVCLCCKRCKTTLLSLDSWSCAAVDAAEATWCLWSAAAAAASAASDQEEKIVMRCLAATLLLWGGGRLFHTHTHTRYDDESGGVFGHCVVVEARRERERRASDK
jgi:hypothetical protein